MALSADGKSLLVVDYALGLTRLDLATATFTPLKIPDGVNAKGIDGLARLPDGSFLASQNGTKEPHILRLMLSSDWSELRSAELIAADDPASGRSLAGDGGCQRRLCRWASANGDRSARDRLQPSRFSRGGSSGSISRTREI